MSACDEDDPHDPVTAAPAAWRERRDRGEQVGVEDLCREHPEIADAIRARAAALEVLGRHLRTDRETDAVRALRRLAGDRYAKFRTVGEGGMGIVYRAIDTDLNREVAFKIVRPDAGGEHAATPNSPDRVTAPPHGTPASQAFETLKSRFLQEAWVTAGLSHPGIGPVY
jgi:hypothetical protein